MVYWSMQYAGGVDVIYYAYAMKILLTWKGNRNLFLSRGQEILYRR